MNKTKKIITAVAILVCAIVASVACVFAYWAGTKTLTQTNTLTIGTKVTTITLSEGSTETGAATEFYPGTRVTYSYTVAVENYDKTGNITVLAALDDTSKSDFDVTTAVYSSGATDAKTGDSANVVVNGDTVKVTVAMKSTVSEKPSYTTATLTVTLAESTAE